ncbi:hypothetical protein QYE76_012112 [Lolium multiflorum]|uniref:Uncharacterized protein n=1 Tax=Lolium multiflorum TaxID=4521 RepID=A0AAD8U0H1_LOLMU|nr:hypothetical protein QYE76_012112 [Lolium multiflorum]
MTATRSTLTPGSPALRGGVARFWQGSAINIDIQGLQEISDAMDEGQACAVKASCAGTVYVLPRQRVGVSGLDVGAA